MSECTACRGLFEQFSSSSGTTRIPLKDDDSRDVAFMISLIYEQRRASLAECNVHAALRMADK